MACAIPGESDQSNDGVCQMTGFLFTAVLHIALAQGAVTLEYGIRKQLTSEKSGFAKFCTPKVSLTKESHPFAPSPRTLRFFEPGGGAGEEKLNLSQCSA